MPGDRGSLTVPREGDPRGPRQGVGPPALGWKEPAPLASVRHLRCFALLTPPAPPPSFPSRFIGCLSGSDTHTHKDVYQTHKGKRFVPLPGAALAAALSPAQVPGSAGRAP